MSSLEKLLSKKTDSQLRYYINHVERHTDEGVLGALAELKKRNVMLPEGIDELIAQKVKNRDSQGNPRRWDHFQRETEIIEVYSPHSICIFAILFPVLTGALMLGSNFSKSGKTGFGPFFYGLSFTIFLLLFNYFIPIGIAFSYLVNLIGAVIMLLLFPNPKDSKIIYVPKPIWKPFVLGILSMTLTNLILILLNY